MRPKAREIAVQAMSCALLWRVDQALALLHAACDEEGQARTARDRAVKRVYEITKSIGDPALRATFLDRRDVKELLSE